MLTWNIHALVNTIISAFMKFTQLSHESEMFYIRPYKDVKYPQHKVS